MAKVWQSDSDKKFYHDNCFETGESREGFTAVATDDVPEDAECGSCELPFDEDDDEDDDTETGDD